MALEWWLQAGRHRFALESQTCWFMPLNSVHMHWTRLPGSDPHEIDYGTRVVNARGQACRRVANFLEQYGPEGVYLYCRETDSGQAVRMRAADRDNAGVFSAAETVAGSP
ncbi:MAG: hypothetical protein HUU35_03260 [Armatimonadetes bacterium]|nr:hypothetical protein [Armatimonadota bacterium]